MNMRHPGGARHWWQGVMETPSVLHGYALFTPTGYSLVIVQTEHLSYYNNSAWLKYTHTHFVSYRDLNGHKLAYYVLLGLERWFSLIVCFCTLAQSPYSAGRYLPIKAWCLNPLVWIQSGRLVERMWNRFSYFKVGATVATFWSQPLGFL